MQKVITPDELKHQQRATLQEPVFVGFACLTCGKRHADLKTLIECAEAKRAANVKH